MLYLGCGRDYDSGIYELERMTVPGYGDHPKQEYPPPASSLAPTDAEASAAAAAAAGFAVVERDCATRYPWFSPGAWRRVAARGNADLYLKGP